MLACAPVVVNDDLIEAAIELSLYNAQGLTFRHKVMNSGWIHNLDINLKFENAVFFNLNQDQEKACSSLI